MLASAGQVEAGSGVVELTNAIFPDVEERFGTKVLPLSVTAGAIKSGVGSELPTLPPEAYWIK